MERENGENIVKEALLTQDALRGFEPYEIRLLRAFFDTQEWIPVRLDVLSRAEGEDKSDQIDVLGSELEAFILSRLENLLSIDNTFTRAEKDFLINKYKSSGLYRLAVNYCLIHADPDPYHDQDILRQLHTKVATLKRQSEAASTAAIESVPQSEWLEVIAAQLNGLARQMSTYDKLDSALSAQNENIRDFIKLVKHLENKRDLSVLIKKMIDDEAYQEIHKGLRRINTILFGENGLLKLKK